MAFIVWIVVWWLDYQAGDRTEPPAPAQIPIKQMIQIISMEAIMTNAHDLLNRPLFTANSFFNKRPFANHHSTTTNTHDKPKTHNMGNNTSHHHKTPNRPHTGENRTAGKTYAHTNRQASQNHAMRFDTNDKPDPVSFYARYGITLKGKQTNIKCVFHSDKTPSLSINADTGAFYCFGCGASGGDVLDFYQRYHSCDFLTACHELNLSQY